MEVPDGIAVSCAKCTRDMHLAALTEHPPLCASCWELMLAAAEAERRPNGFILGI